MHIQTHFRGYIFFRITVLVSTKYISKTLKNNVIYYDCFPKYVLEKKIRFFPKIASGLKVFLMRGQRDLRKGRS